MFFLFFSGCTYSFKGGSVPPHLTSVAIPIAEDQSGLGDATLRERFTRQLVDRFQSDNTLQLADRTSADALLECVIVDVKDKPNTLQAGEQVASWRVTVSVRAVFQDLKLRKQVWEKTFSQWGDHTSSSLDDRALGLDEAVRKLTEDILNETVAGW